MLLVLSSYFSITNPTPIANTTLITTNYDYVGKSIVLNVSNLEGTGLYQFFNIAVIKTVNGITTPEIVGTYSIDSLEKIVE